MSEEAFEKRSFWSSVKSFWRKCGYVLLEAFLIVLFSQLPVLIAALISRAGSDEKDLEATTFLEDIFSIYSVEDVFTYSTGVLGSAIVFFVLEMKIIKNRTRVIFTGIVIPLLVIFFAALIPPMVSLSSGNPNSFVQSYSSGLLVILMVTWLLALFEKRNIEERKADLERLEGDEERRKMTKKARKNIG
ncbi:hypothetical protein [Rhodovulum sp.]|uniref:hypothetical protein n=1 Tax=Rhodovulum sp. TaxID=34009 RepID=UPI001828A5FF|nr:hypothetical protein [Rhodovulum sp.]HDR28606.1 hypothetical protein [Rhodovulum sp.]